MIEPAKCLDAIVPSRTHMTRSADHQFGEGDRVVAPSRPGFPKGTILKLMDLGFVLVRWDGDVLETAHHLELTKAEPDEL